MVKLYHGTTEESCRSILANGFCHTGTAWNYSNPKLVYCYHSDRVAKVYNLAPDEVQQRCFEMALSSAFFSAALKNSQSHNLFVFEMLISDRVRGSISKDTSTGEWDGISVTFPAEEMNYISCNVYAALDCYSPRLSPLFLFDRIYQGQPLEVGLTDMEKSIINRMDPELIDSFLNTVYEHFFQTELVMVRHNERVGKLQQAKAYVQDALKHYQHYQELQKARREPER